MEQIGRQITTRITPIDNKTPLGLVLTYTIILQAVVPVHIN